MSLLQILLSLVLGLLGAVLIIAGTMVRYRFATANTRLAVSIVALIFSLLGVGAACIFGTQVVQLLTTGVSTRGTIVDIVPCGSKGRVSPSVQFTDAKGIRHTQSITGFCSSPQDHRVGEPLSIIYVPADPTIVAEEGSTSSSAMFVLGALTALIILVAWFLFASIKLMARPKGQHEPA